MQFQSANGLHILNFNRGEGNRTSPSSPGMCAPGDQLCPHCQWCMQEMPGASLGGPHRMGTVSWDLCFMGLGLGPSGGCWWEVRDKFWLLSGPLPTAVPRAMAASPTGRWSGLQLSLPKRFLEPVSESISTETLTLRKRLYVIGNWCIWSGRRLASAGHT